MLDPLPSFKLEADGFLQRYVGDDDRRRLNLKLTRAGATMLARLAEPARRAQARVLSAFAAHEQEQFLRLLDKFNRAFNGSTRVPLLGAHPRDPSNAPAPPARAVRRSARRRRRPTR